MSDILSKFTTRVSTAPEPVATPPLEEASENKRAYQAVRMEQQNRRTPGKLRIVYGNGNVSLMSYQVLQEVLCTPPAIVTLIYSHCWIVITGRNLLPLADQLQYDKATTLTCYNARLHDEPEPGAPVITQIERKGFVEPKAAPANGPQNSKTAEVGR